MYGMIHKAARRFTLDNYTENHWNTILAKAGVDEGCFISGQHYSDEVTFGLISAISETINMEAPDLLTAFGEYWVKYTASSSYATVLEMSGNDVVTFITNLDNLHTSIQATMPEAVLPSFSITYADDKKIELTYRSQRTGLETFVKGLLLGILQRFNETGEVEFSSPNEDGTKFTITRTIK